MGAFEIFKVFGEEIQSLVNISVNVLGPLSDRFKVFENRIRLVFLGWSRSCFVRLRFFLSRRLLC